MKSRVQKRREAIERSKSYTFENSKAKRKGTRTEAKWEERNKEIYGSEK